MGWQIRCGTMPDYFVDEAEADYEHIQYTL